MAYTYGEMEFLETSVFTRFVMELMLDDAYRKLHLVLIANPGAGALIRGRAGFES
jgi:hypothetical protein